MLQATVNTSKLPSSPLPHPPTLSPCALANAQVSSAEKNAQILIRSVTEHRLRHSVRINIVWHDIY